VKSKSARKFGLNSIYFPHFFLSLALVLGVVQTPQNSFADTSQEIEIKQSKACPVSLATVWEPFKVPYPCFQSGQLLNVKVPRASRLPGQMLVALNGGTGQIVSGGFFSIPEYEIGLNTISFDVVNPVDGSKTQILEQRFIVYSTPQMRQMAVAVEEKTPYVITLDSGVAIADFTTEFEIAENEFQIKTVTSSSKIRVARTLVADLSQTQHLAIIASKQASNLVPEAVISLNATQTTTSWALDRIDQVSPVLDGKYNYDNRGQGVDVYIIDSGIREDHAEFTGRIREAAFVSPLTSGTDCDGHGTHVAGLAAGTTYGAAKLANIISVRVFDCAGDGTTSGIIEAINWINARHTPSTPAVVNMSLGGFFDEEFNLATQSLIDDGIVTVVAAGNEFGDACDYSPSSAPNAITVGGTTRNDRDSDFSNVGPCVDIFAPGTDILSAGITSSSAFETFSGTSMASPLVAGAAALVLERNFSTYPNKLAANSLVRDTLVNEATSNALTKFASGIGWYIDTANKLLYVKNIIPAPLLTISNTPTTVVVGTRITLTTTGGSGTGAVTFTVSGANCSISRSVLSARSAATCVVTATKAESVGFAALTSAPVSFIFLGPQATLSISNTTTAGVVGTPIALTTSGGSGSGAVTYAVTGTGCSITAANLSATVAASCAVVATKAAEGIYATATSAARSFSFLGPQTTLSISNAITSVVVGTRVTLTTTGGSGSGAVTFTTVSAGCSISRTTLTARSAATCVVVATKASEGIYASATSAPKSFAFSGPQETLIISNAITSSVIGTPITLTTSGGSGLGAVTYVTTSAGCTILGATLSTNTAANCVVVATKAAEGVYATATSAARTFSFLGPQATLSISNTPTTFVVGTRITLTTAGGSGSGAVNYTVSGNSCTLSRNTLRANIATTCVVVATKAAQGIYGSATSAPVSFVFAGR
jgi:subtilisin family serine protease